VNPSRFWQGRERYTVFDTAYGNGARGGADRGLAQRS
jgi:hypothetical protein